MTKSKYVTPKKIPCVFNNTYVCRLCGKKFLHSFADRHCALDLWSGSIAKRRRKRKRKRWKGIRNLYTARNYAYNESFWDWLKSEREKRGSNS